MSRRSPAPRRTRGVLGGRSEQVVARVLDAARFELVQSGYAAFRMEEVASRASVNKTTIYRRWPSRASLVGSVFERMRASLRDSRLPDTGALETDLIEAFSRRFSVGRKREGRAWARLLDERHEPEVETLIGATVDERRREWQSMVDRAIGRGELPTKTDSQLLFDFVRALVDARGAAARLDRARLTIAVKTIVAGARAGTLVRPPPRTRA